MSGGSRHVLRRRPITTLPGLTQYAFEGAVTLLDKRHEDPFAPLEVVVGSLVRTARTTSNFAHGERRGPTLIEEIAADREDCLAQPLGCRRARHALSVAETAARLDNV